MDYFPEEYPKGRLLPQIRNDSSIQGNGAHGLRSQNIRYASISRLNLQEMPSAIIYLSQAK